MTKALLAPDQLDILGEASDDLTEAHTGLCMRGVDMDAAELVDPRPNDDAPLALWRNRIVLSVHHDGAGAMPTTYGVTQGKLR